MNTGINKIRDVVIEFGMFIKLVCRMKLIVDILRQFFTYPGYFSNIYNTCLCYSLNSAKMFQ